MIRENPGDLAAERLVHAVIVVGVQEAPLLQPAPQPLYLVIGEVHVSVARHEDVRDVPQLGARERHDPLALGDGERGALAQGREEVRQGGRTGVPVAATVVMQPSDCQRCGGASGRGTRDTGYPASEPIHASRSPHPASRPPAGDRQPRRAEDDRQGSHSSLTSRYAVFLVIPVSVAICSATSRRVIPCASRTRARTSGSGAEGRSSRAGLPVPATITVTSPRGGASA